MKWLKDIHNRRIRLTEERQEHIETDHPEMSGRIDRILETLLNPDVIVRSRTDPDVELFYRYYDVTPVTEKYLCVVVKVLAEGAFIITAYFTDTIKKGETLWKRR
ncbi:MAG: PBECR2 nuclease fold domain-containing protein [Candidatus Freyrarchaeum guaymaensis]|nr:PBECR2 nuclease fold domain-containing protein [Candidatus Sigynarchaeota archaeon]